MEYIIFLTYRCNLNCEYCFAKNLVHNREKNTLSITQDKIISICKYIERDIKINHCENNSIVFFGGEPSLVPNIIEEIIKRTEHLRLNYSIYSNGLLLDRLPDFILKKLQTILVAVDGDKENHEKFKPVGSYETILNNVRAIKGKTKAQVIGRITLEENSNLYYSVKNLLNSFDFVHWQIVNKENFNNPEKFIAEYKQNLQRLFRDWIDALSSGVVLNIIPFNRIVLSLLSNEALASFRCGCGSTIQAIDVDGNIYLCDEYIENANNSLGTIYDDNHNLISHKNHFNLFGDCSQCRIASICLGRCRKMLETQPQNNIRVYCKLTRILVDMVVESIEKIEQIVSNQNMDLSNFHAEIYDTEVIP
ncbi:MAG: 4Fe-4S cluster-binding domain-containing protein [Ruminococcaceae bacterium]|nr:4Fe-4S cluster-binding domain-containing protein [Oscillospiraceae bacterium]